MLLGEILKDTGHIEILELQSDHHSSLYIPKDNFYIESNYDPIHVEQYSRFTIFSAPGASGKSALAKHLAFYYGGIYWDLSKISIGENTFQGTLWRALKQEQLYGFWDDLAQGKGVLALDSFDEAELISGRNGVEFFLRDVYEVIESNTIPTVFLFARTETAKFIERFCLANSISYSMYEISFFSEKEAKMFVSQRYIKLGNKFTKAVEDCIDMQFATISNVLCKNDMSKSFLGYAPVLEALSSSLDESRNTIKILESIKADANAGAKIVFNILKDLLKREQKKVENALFERCHAKVHGFNQWNSIYTETEQIVRIMEYILFHQIEYNSLFSNESIPEEIYDDYYEILSTQLVQHPFLQNLSKNQGYDFAGPAFRDYSLSYLMCGAFDDLAYEYFTQNGIASQRSSQLLFDFFVENNCFVTGENFVFVYDAFKAKEDIHKKCKVDVFLEGNEGVALFSLLDDEITLLNKYEIPFLCDNPSINILRISNTSILTDKDVVIGQKSNNAQISDSYIFANKIIFSTRHLLITSSEFNKCVLISKNDVIYNDFGIPTFDIRCGKGIEVSFPNLSVFYKLRTYAIYYDVVYTEDFMRFYIFVIRVLGLISKHKKYVGKKDKEYIDNKIIGTNQFKRCLMDFLIDIGVIYKVHNELRWYELDVDCLAKYGLSQIMLKYDNEQEFMMLYKMFLRSKNYENYLKTKTN